MTKPRIAISISIVLCLGTHFLFGQNIDSLKASVDRIKSLEGRIKTDTRKDLDARLYKDIDPDNYSIEGSRIYRLANIRYVKLVFYSINTAMIRISFHGETETLRTEYIYVDGKVIYARKDVTPNELQVKELENGEQSVSIGGNSKEYYFLSDNVIDFKDSSFPYTKQKADSSLVEETILDSKTYFEYK